VFFESDADGKTKDFGFKEKALKTVVNEKKDTVVVSPGHAVSFNKTNVTPKPAADEGYSMGYFKTSQASDNLSAILENPSIDAKKATITINEKPATYEEMIKLDPNGIVSSSVSARSSDGLATVGSISIELKGFRPEPSKKEAAVDDGKPLLDYKNGGFIIHKKSGKNDFEFYEAQLAKIDLKLEISKLERNSNGEITAIRVEVTDTKNGTGGVAFWNTPVNKQGIPDIEIGRRNGKVLVRSTQ
jgi:hypothetical protein